MWLIGEFYIYNFLKSTNRIHRLLSICQIRQCFYASIYKSTNQIEIRRNMNNKAGPITPSRQKQFSTENAINLTIMLFGRKKTKQNPTAATAQEAPPKPKQKKRTGLAVAKYEIAQDKVKFYAAKGALKKRWVVINEFPIYDISAVESLGNWLSINWNGTAYPFILKQKNASFAKLNEQIEVLREEYQRKLEQTQKAALRKTELLAVINGSLPIVDSSFDVLMGLNQKRIDWKSIEADAQPLAVPYSFKAATLEPLDLDFSKVAAAVKSQVAKETSKETLNGLKAIHSYFIGLKLENDLAGTNPNFEHAKAAVLAYYTLNDLLLAKIVGEKDSQKEQAYLEETLKTLSDGTNVKVDVVGLLACVNKMVVEAERENGVFEARTLFREQLKQL